MIDFISNIISNIWVNFIIMNVVENIKLLRAEKGIPQKKIADALNVDIAVISNIENGKRELKVSELEIIASCLEVTVVDLFTYPEKYISTNDLNDDIVASLTIQLRKDKKDQVLKLVFGDNSLEILNK